MAENSAQKILLNSNPDKVFFPCQHCGRTISIPKKSLGIQGKCAHRKKIVQAPNSYSQCLHCENFIFAKKKCPKCSQTISFFASWRFFIYTLLFGLYFAGSLLSFVLALLLWVPKPFVVAIIMGLISGIWTAISIKDK